MLPTAAGSILLKSVSQKVSWSIKQEKYVLQFACLMQTGINGCEIYKNIGMMHAVVFADRAPEAKIAQVMGENQNSKGLKKRKIAIGTARRARRANKIRKNALFEAAWGSKRCKC